VEGAITVPHSAALEQGDVFLDVPILDAFDIDGEAQFRLIAGPAILLTHGCAMDKPVRDTSRPKIEYLSFARLRTTDDLTVDRKQLLRNNQVTPYEVMYLGRIRPVGECYFSLHETYSVPAFHFDLTLIEHAGQRSAAPQRNDTRVATISVAQRSILTSKLHGFWTREVPASDALA